MNKRGDYSAIFVFMVMSLIIVLFMVVFTYIGVTVEDKMHEKMDSLTFGNANTSQIIDDTIGKVNNSYNGFTWISIFLIVSMIIAILIGSYLVTTHPIFFIPYIFVVIIAVLVGAGISNAYETIMNHATLSSTFDEFGGANWFLLRLPVINAIVGFAGGIIMFISWRVGSRQQIGGYYG